MSNKARFEKLLEPAYIGKVRTRNRMIKTAAAMTLTSEGGDVSEKRKDMYEALAKGGIGLIIVEGCPIEFPPESFQQGLLCIDNDTCLPGYSELTQVVHKHNCPVFLQMMHLGAWLADNHLQQRWSEDGISMNISPSSLTENEVPGPGFGIPREATLAEIKRVINTFIKGAENAKKVGFDGVEINAATCHMGNAFLSRAWNKRQDAYGCASLENRARFVVEIIQGIKRRVGQDFPVSVIINGAEYGTENGTTIEEAKGLARIIQDAGADAIQIRSYGYGDYASLDVPIPDYLFTPEPPDIKPKELDWSRKGVGVMVPLAAAVKKVVSIPVITVGRLDPVYGEQVLEEGKADFIGLTRRLFADPELPNKVASGRLEDISPCTACLECHSAVNLDKPFRCRVNAAMGADKEYSVIEKAAKKKRVVVVGGGPAGMEAARVAAIRGHEVLLYEKEPKLGGLLPLATMVKGTDIEDLPALLRYFKTQMAKLGVKINLGQEFNPSLAEEIKPDVVILAAGGVPAVPEIAGINRHIVVSTAKLHHQLKSYLRFMDPNTLRWLTKFWMPLGKRVIIIGGALQGCELAEFLIKRGRNVTIVDTIETFGEGVPELKKLRFFNWLTKKGAVLLAGVKYEEITDKGLTVITREGKRQTIEADSIVTAVPFRQNTGLLKSLEKKVPEIYAIGDCNEPRRIVDAISDGYRIGRAA